MFHLKSLFLKMKVQWFISCQYGPRELSNFLRFSLVTMILNEYMLCVFGFGLMYMLYTIIKQEF